MPVFSKECGFFQRVVIESVVDEFFRRSEYPWCECPEPVASEKCDVYRQAYRCFNCGQEIADASFF